MQRMPRDFRVELLRRSLKFSRNVEQSYGQRRLDRRIDIKIFILQERVTIGMMLRLVSILE